MYTFDSNNSSKLDEKTGQLIFELLGRPPFYDPPPLNPKVVSSKDMGRYVRHKVRYGNESDDIVWAYLLIPKKDIGKRPAVICWPGSYITRNCGKEVVVGLEQPDNPDDPEAYGHDLAIHGFITLCPDYPCCGERTSPGLASHDTTILDQRFPAWTRTGMSVWDVTRAVDYLLTLLQVDPNRIGCTGFSQGGMMSLWGAAIDRRIAAVVTVCGWSPFRGRDLKPLLTSCNYPRLQNWIDQGQPVPDIKDRLTMMIAPRPFMDLRGRHDHHFLNVTEIDELGTKITRQYRELGASDQFTRVCYDHGHQYTPVIRDAMMGWFDRWLSRVPTHGATH